MAMHTWRNKFLLWRKKGPRPQTAKAMTPTAGINWSARGLARNAWYDLQNKFGTGNLHKYETNENTYPEKEKIEEIKSSW